MSATPSAEELVAAVKEVGSDCICIPFDNSASLAATFSKNAFCPGRFARGHLALTGSMLRTGQSSQPRLWPQAHARASQGEQAVGAVGKEGEEGAPGGTSRSSAA